MITLEEIHPEDNRILPLYADAGWENYTRQPDMLHSAFRHSLCALGAVEGDTLLGLVRLVGDGYSCVLIQDLLVRRDHQRQGIGTALMRAMLDVLREAGCRQASLSVQKANYAVRMYRNVGFEVIGENDEEYIMRIRLA